MKLVDVEITGITPLLQHRFTEEAEQAGSTRKVLITHGTPREQAEGCVYRMKSGQCYFPAAAIGRLLREAGSSHKLKGTRKSLKYIVPAAVFVPHDTIGLGNGTPITDYEVDSRPVTIPATKGRIMRHRPRFDKWGASFSLEIDDTLLPVAIIHQLLQEGGLAIGIGDYRPEKGGPFGRFRVTRWDERAVG